MPVGIVHGVVVISYWRYYESLLPCSVVGLVTATGVGQRSFLTVPYSTLHVHANECSPFAAEAAGAL